MDASGDLLNVVDVEATCWEGTPPPGAVSEIIEIGLTVVDLRSPSPAAAPGRRLPHLPDPAGGDAGAVRA